jgi:hypothetical protein
MMMSVEVEEACERCGRLLAGVELQTWTEAERTRVFSGVAAPEADSAAKGNSAPGARPIFDYVHTDHVYRVCARCYAQLTAGATFSAPAQKRSVIMLVAIFVAIAALAILTPFILPSLMSAFWRT